MKLWKKLSIGVVVFLVVLVGAGAILVSRHTDGLCENVQLAQVPSPDGRLKAVIFERGCGATTGYVTHVSLLARDEALVNEGGNVFVADGHRGLVGGLEVQVSWLSNGRLGIAYLEPATDVIRKESRSSGIRIEYTSLSGRATR